MGPMHFKKMIWRAYEEVGGVGEGGGGGEGEKEKEREREKGEKDSFIAGRVPGRSKSPMPFLSGNTQLSGSGSGVSESKSKVCLCVCERGGERLCKGNFRLRRDG